jgi:hypothetical protein
VELMRWISPFSMSRVNLIWPGNSMR